MINNNRRQPTSTVSVYSISVEIVGGKRQEAWNPTGPLTHLNDRVKRHNYVIIRVIYTTKITSLNRDDHDGTVHVMVKYSGHRNYYYWLIVKHVYDAAFGTRTRSTGSKVIFFLSYADATRRWTTWWCTWATTTWPRRTRRSIRCAECPACCFTLTSIRSCWPTTSRCYSSTGRPPWARPYGPCACHPPPVSTRPNAI